MARKAKPSKASSQLDLMAVAESPAKPVPTKPAKALAEKPSTAPEPKRPQRRASAEDMAKKQREISVSEFFTKNRHLLGFDNPQKAMLTAIKEAVDNALDACEEAGILPEIEVAIREISEGRYRIAIDDNGPGIPKPQIPKVFGKLLYGSKFHRLKQSRGQQGIGISAAGMYAQLTTGKPVHVVSRTGKGRPAVALDITLNTRLNQPEMSNETVDEKYEKPHGTRVELELSGLYKKGKRSVDEYLMLTAVSNPHARIIFRPPAGEAVIYERASEELPVEALEIKPHPHGVELGMLIKMLQDTSGHTVKSALKGDFSRVSDMIAEEICQMAKVKPSAKPRNLTAHDIEALYKAMQTVKIMAPPSNCLSPIGEARLEASLKARFKAAFVTSTTRKPVVYRGNPFQIEVGLAYGGDLPADELCDVFRFANRVPLQYQQGACAIHRSVLTTDWKSYGLQQSRGALPTGPFVVMVHMASVWVPFTSESKEAIAHYDEIIKEIKLAIQECGRRLKLYVSGQRRTADEFAKRSYMQKYIPLVGEALRLLLELNQKQEQEVTDRLRKVLERTRATALPIRRKGTVSDEELAILRAADREAAAAQAAE
ncbi:MAG: DNA topoisomerase VI subunit B [Deltaproteobacteria bacterium]|nr:DNA topoisomerase VI subunit B [Deltaproteobacteria bacterium]